MGLDDHSQSSIFRCNLIHPSIFKIKNSLSGTQVLHSPFPYKLSFFLFNIITKVKHIMINHFRIANIKTIFHIMIGS